jgi:hypothetical protein
VFTRTAKLTVAKGAVGNGLTLDGKSLVTRRATGKQALQRSAEETILAPLTAR